MIILMAVIILVLAGWIYIEKQKQKKIKKDLIYITNKLEDIIKDNSTERILLNTTDKEIRDAVNSVNNLLDFDHKNYIKYNKSKISMKKMLSNISHDLKTPLTVVLGYLEMLQLKYKGEENIKRTYQKTQEVLDLINKFFDLAKLESGDKEISLERLDICEVCRMNIIDYCSTLEQKQFEVEVNIPEKPIFIFGNKEVLHRILNNLISNAIKYGGEGKYLGLNVKEDEKQVTVEVVDKGKGIEEIYKEDVFERMYTLEDSRSRNYQGSGLGLTITKELVEYLEGEIHLDSIPYVKTTFYFALNKINF